MTAAINSLTGAPLAYALNWDSINWKKVERQVKRLQMRIAKATRRPGLFDRLSNGLSHVDRNAHAWFLEEQGWVNCPCLLDYQMKGGKPKMKMENFGLIQN